MSNEQEVRLVAYEVWANSVVIAAVEKVQPTERIKKLLGHLVGAKEMWVARLVGRETSGIQVWPMLEVAEACARLKRADEEFGAFVKGCGDLGALVNYKTTTGTPFSTSRRDIIVHVVNHSSYHRGQLATAIKEAGGEMGPTDYVLWTRTVSAA